MKKMTALLLAAVLTAAGLSARGRTDQKPGDEKKFTVALSGEIASLDPKFVYDYDSGRVAGQIYETLLGYDRNDKLIPKLAESWRAVDNLTYVYNIRRGVTFSDGTPLTAEDVVFSIENVRQEESYLSWMFDVVDSVRKTGDFEVTVTLKRPSASWPHVLASTGGVISKDYFQKHQGDFGTAKGGIIATGPYVFDHWTSGQEVVIKKNPNYWDRSNPGYLDTIVYKIIPDDNTRITALRTGEIDFTGNPPLSLLSVINADPNLKTLTYGSFSIVFLAFNTQREPFTDINVRKAIYHALDLESLQRNIIKDAGSTGTVLPQGEALYGQSPQQWKDYLARAPKYEYNLEKAKEYLAKSGVPNGFSFNLLTHGDSLRIAMALFIQESLAKINIKVEITQVSGDEHTKYQFGGVLDSEGKRDYDTLLGGWTADYPDIGGNIEPLYLGTEAGEGGLNTAAYVNQRVTALLQEENTLTDETERNKLIFQALDIITNEIPYLFVTYPNRQVVHNIKWGGIDIRSNVSAGGFTFNKVRPAQ
ncbi:MAG: ABC transporter substrate-binding protein [Treponema sp.]|jgi:peptide/nickel transport system substrate-binding protein|nr:ABC transporter substrate-binding protein [Treponema sp.]